MEQRIVANRDGAWQSSEQVFSKAHLPKMKNRTTIKQYRMLAGYKATYT